MTRTAPKQTRVTHSPQVRRVSYASVLAIRLTLPCGKPFLMAPDIAYALGRRLVRAALEAKQETRIVRSARTRGPLVSAKETHA